MSQAAYLRQLDADMMAGFLDAGIADAATYTPAGGVPVACSVLVDSDLASIGQVAPSSDKTRAITLFKSEIGNPVSRATVEVEGDVFTLIERALDDDSRSVWVARHD